MPTLCREGQRQKLEERTDHRDFENRKADLTTELMLFQDSPVLTLPWTSMGESLLQPGKQLWYGPGFLLGG